MRLDRMRPVEYNPKPVVLLSDPSVVVADPATHIEDRTNASCVDFYNPSRVISVESETTQQSVMLALAASGTFREGLTSDQSKEVLLPLVINAKKAIEKADRQGIIACQAEKSIQAARNPVWEAKLRDEAIKRELTRDRRPIGDEISILPNANSDIEDYLNHIDDRY